MLENDKIMVDVLEINKETPLCIYVHNASFMKTKKSDIQNFKFNINKMFDSFIENKGNHFYQLDGKSLFIMKNLIAYPYNIKNPTDKPFIESLEKTNRLLFEYQQNIQDKHFRSIIGLFENKKLSFVFKTNEFQLCTQDERIDLQGFKFFIQKQLKSKV